MLFNSFEFLGLLLVTFVVYYLPIGKKSQPAVLVTSSLLFYSAHTPILVVLLLSSILFNATMSRKIDNGSSIRSYATIAIIVNLLTLAFFKYSGLLVRTLFDQPPAFLEFLVKIPLPIGISFFTFEGISLIADTYSRRKAGVAPLSLSSTPQHVVKVALFISFFPHLIAGPILKAHDFIPQISSSKRFRDIDWLSGCRCLIIGYFLKMVIADNLQDQTYWIAYPFFLSKSSFDLIVLLFGYSMQIFSDFAGYSLIAVGLAHLFGYQLMHNFRFPYIAESFSEFWQRWHISLSTFLKEYLYIPLGGNRKGALRTYLNLLLVMFLGGLWHGAAWSYAVWGLMHGFALAAERWVQGHFKLRLWRPLKLLGVFCYVTAAWLLFKLTDFSQVLAYVRAIWNNGSLYSNMDVLAIVMMYSSAPVAYHALYAYRRKKPEAFSSWMPFAYAVMLFLIITNSGSGTEFIYFQF